MSPDFVAEEEKKNANDGKLANHRFLVAVTLIHQ